VVVFPIHIAKMTTPEMKEEHQLVS